MPKPYCIDGCLSHVDFALWSRTLLMFRDTGNGSRSFFCLKCETSVVMKSNSLIVPVTGSRKRVQVSNFFSWTVIQKFFNAVPGEITPCKSIYEAKMYTLVLTCALSLLCPLLLILAYAIYSSAKKEGRNI